MNITCSEAQERSRIYFLHLLFVKIRKEDYQNNFGFLKHESNHNVNTNSKLERSKNVLMQSFVCFWTQNIAYTAVTC